MKRQLAPVGSDQVGSSASDVVACGCAYCCPGVCYCQEVGEKTQDEQEKERDTLCALVTNVEVYMQCKQHLRGNEGIVMHCNVHKPPDRFKIQLTSL